MPAAVFSAAVATNEISRTRSRVSGSGGMTALSLGHSPSMCAPMRQCAVWSRGSVRTATFTAACSASRSASTDSVGRRPVIFGILSCVALILALIAIWRLCASVGLGTCVTKSTLLQGDRADVPLFEVWDVCISHRQYSTGSKTQGGAGTHTAWTSFQHSHGGRTFIIS